MKINEKSFSLCGGVCCFLTSFVLCGSTNTTVYLCSYCTFGAGFASCVRWSNLIVKNKEKNSSNSCNGDSSLCVQSENIIQAENIIQSENIVQAENIVEIIEPQPIKNEPQPIKNEPQNTNKPQPIENDESVTLSNKLYVKNLN